MDLYLQSRLAPLRVGATHATLDLLCADPLLFAAHYATVADSLRKLGWPAEVNALLGRVGERYHAHDAVLDLMDTLRGQLPMALAVDLARRMAEGMELHAELGATRDIYRTQCAGVLACVNLDVSEEHLEHLGDDTPAGRLALLSRVPTVPRQAHGHLQHWRITLSKSCIATTITCAMYKGWPRGRALAMLHEPEAKIQRYRAPDSLIDFLKTL
jgi:hypothetical protein